MIKNFEKGQSLVELLVAIAVFTLIISGLAVFVLDSYSSGRLSQELTIADFLAQEGIEATKSIRGDKWQNLKAGIYGLTLSGNKWILQDQPEDISNDFGRNATRTIIIEDIALNQKKITSKVSWDFSPVRPEEVSLVTYLTNWEVSGAHLSQNIYRWRDDNGGE